MQNITMGKLKIKTGDTVKVIAGDHKGSEGKVLKVLTDKNKAIVEGINMVKKHMKPSADNPQGGIVEKEASIQISNLSLLTSNGEATRVGYRMEGDKKVRFAKKSNEVI
jgi:large subunit ribosomal protein L24